MLFEDDVFKLNKSKSDSRADFFGVVVVVVAMVVGVLGLLFSAGLALAFSFGLCLSLK